MSEYLVIYNSDEIDNVIQKNRELNRPDKPLLLTLENYDKLVNRMTAHYRYLPIVNNIATYRGCNLIIRHTVNKNNCDICNHKSSKNNGYLLLCDIHNKIYDAVSKLNAGN